jgi:glycine/serine hydroxymethyltransferase
MGTEEMRVVGAWIARVLDQPTDEGVAREVAAGVKELANAYPLFSWTARSRTGVRAG